jgi:hypothetical protein
VLYIQIMIEAETKTTDTQTDTQTQTQTDTQTETVQVDRVNEINKLKDHYKLFYKDLITKIFEPKDQPILTPKLPLEDVIKNASKVLNIKHVPEMNGDIKLEIDNNNDRRQIILDGLVYKGFKLDEKDNTITFIEHDSINDVDLAMRISKSSGEIEVEDWTKPSEWLSLDKYLDKLMTKYTTHVVLDNIQLTEKRSFWKTHYANVKRLVLDLDNVFTTREYYNV